jgi:hypothetical protein
MLGKDDLDEGAARTGENECTMESKAYDLEGPVAGQLWDIPGGGTPNFPADEYIKQRGLRYYDVLVILTAGRWTELDTKLFEAVRRFKIPAFIVRTKIDETIRSGLRKKKTETQCMNEAREFLKTMVNGEESDRIFLITAVKEEYPEFLLLEFAKLMAKIDQECARVRGIKLVPQERTEAAHNEEKEFHANLEEIEADLKKMNLKQLKAEARAKGVKEAEIEGIDEAEGSPLDVARALIINQLKINRGGCVSPAAASGGGGVSQAAAGGGAERKANRWGDGLDAPAAGRREFFPSGWTPTQGVYDSITVFGHKAADLERLKARGEHLQVQLRLMDVANVCAELLASIHAYTEENEHMLYSQLNHACRTPGGMAEKKLRIYDNYLYHLDKGYNTLPNYSGTVYRGTDALMSEDTYTPGKVITWQQFSSTSKKQQVARKFLCTVAGVLSGSIFIMKVKTGKEIELLSAFPEEMEVLLGLNSFFKVEAKLDSEADKCAQLASLSRYDMTGLDVYVLSEI